MTADQLKHKIKELFGENIIFNKEFNKFSKVLRTQEKNLIVWCESVQDGKIIAYPSTVFNDYMLFIKKIGSSNRCVVIKIKNDGFKEIHLGDHKYYDMLRRKFGLKRDNRL